MAGEMLHFKHLPKLYRLFQKEEASFADHYRTEIAAKFVAVTTCSASGNKKKPAKIEKAEALYDNDDDDEDAMEDAALEAMLDAESAQNTMMFHDDFDLMAKEGTLGDAIPMLGNDTKNSKKKRKKPKGQSDKAHAGKRGRGATG